MKKNFKKSRRILIALAVTAIISGHVAFAADALVVPRKDIVLTGNVLTVADIFDGVTHDGDHVLAAAPAYGSSIVLSAQDLTRISNAFNLGWFPAGGETVTIRRDARDLDHYQIEAAVQDELKKELQGQKYEAELSDRSLTMHLPSDNTSGLAVDNLKYDLNKNEFRGVAVAGGTRQEISGHLYAVTAVPVLNKALRNGDVISVDDIQYLDMRSSDVSVSMAVSADSLVGQTPRRGIAAMKPVALGDIVLPPAIKKGELVTMTLKSGTIEVTAQGRAMQNASVGDVIRVTNTSSNQVIEAVVTGLRQVDVKAPSEALVNVPVRTSLNEKG